MGLAKSTLGIAAAGLAVFGCASDGLSSRELKALAAADERTRCESDVAVLRDATGLVTRAREAAGRGEMQASYCHFALLRTLHAESPETRESFPLAATVFKGLYQRAYYDSTSKDSTWLAREPRFMFDWLSTFFAGEEFPRSAVMAIMHDMPMPFWTELAEYVENASGPIHAWKLTPNFDNGRIDDVRGERLTAAQP